MKRVAEAENEPVLRKEQVVGVTVVPVEPETVLIVFDVEDVQVAVRIADYIRRLLELPYEYSKRACVVFRIMFLALASYTK